MTDPVQNPPARQEPIRRLLAELRWRIRRYVLLEGCAIALVWLACTYWLAYALDYLPVLAGSSEMPVLARAVLLALITLVLVAILYRWVLRRVLARLPDSSMALLLEHHYPEFHDSLITAVEFRDEKTPASGIRGDLLRQTRRQASAQLDTVDVERVFDPGPLWRAGGCAAALLLSVLFYALVSPAWFGLTLQRLYALSPDPYPRRTQIEVLGFENAVETIARGSDLAIRVRADATLGTPPPNYCTIHYRCEDGDRGRVQMSKIGAPRDGFQRYTYEGKPFKGVLSDLTFDVVGNDHRLRDFRVRVVDSPQVVGVDLDCELPDYTELLPRRESYRPGIRLPRGSRVTIQVQTNKPLNSAEITDLQSGDSHSLTPAANTPSASRVTYVIAQLDESISQEIELLDTDGIRSKRPYRVAITALEDQAPLVSVRLRGIGSAITPEARLPVEGEITDDFGVARSWFEVQIPDESPRTLPVNLVDGRRVESALDLREQRSSDPPLALDVETQVSLSVKSADSCALAEEPNVGESDRYQLEVVTPNRLLALLEARELGLRRRFEQIILEMRETRDSLSRVTDDAEEALSDITETTTPVAAGSEPEDDATAPDDARNAALDPATAEARRRSLRLLRVQRATQHCPRASQEVLGVAVSFDDIREELINNRVDSTDRQQRIENEISRPLKLIAEGMFPVLEQILLELEAEIGNQSVGPRLTAAAVDQADQILLAMDRVLEKMLDLESYNELVGLVRALIQDQEELTEKTKKQQKKQALDLLR